MFYTRQLKVQDWKSYRDMRVEAVALHEDKFSVPLAVTLQKTQDTWQSNLQTTDSAVFGLYDDDIMIGLTSIFKDGENTQTAILAGSYVKEYYRGRGLSRLLYQTRIAWAKAHGKFERVQVGHRKGNIASAKAIQNFGFKFVIEKEHIFGDGSMDTLLVYELRIK